MGNNKTIVNVYENKYITMGWHKANGKMAFILKDLRKGNYLHVYKESLSDFGLNDFIKSYPKNCKNEVDKDYEKNSLLKITDNCNFKVIIELENEMIGVVNDNKNNRYFSFEHDDLKRIEDSYFVLKNIEIYRNKIVKKEKSYKTEEELRSILTCEDDFLIIRHLNHELCIDQSQIKRFLAKDLSLKETGISKDLNKAWIDY